MATIITLSKVLCPFCKNRFTGRYCPSCGLPKRSSKFEVDKYGYLCKDDSYHFRPEFTSFEKFQLCIDCYTANPSDAKYCKNCGKDISSQARDRNGHGWVDLGLSVLWSSESINGYYYWRDTVDILEHNICGKIGLNYRQEDDLTKRTLAGKDTASYKWGHKWRMPTKEEFKELIEKCSWELQLIPDNSRSCEKNTIKAFKVTGPNGNHIYLPALGYAHGSYKPDWSFLTWRPEICSYGVTFGYWSSTKDLNKNRTYAYVFCPRISFVHPDSSERVKEKLLERQELHFSPSTPIDERIKLFMRPEYVSESHYEAYSVRPVADKKWLGKL